LALSITASTAGGASGGARAMPVRRIEVDSPPRLWAKIFRASAASLRGIVVPLVPAEAGGSFEGSAAISAAVGGLGAATAASASAATAFWRASIIVRPLTSASRAGRPWCS
jgi:hypothetical protein